MATEWVNSDNLFVSGTVEADGSASVTVGARFEHASVVLLAETASDREALADLLRGVAAQIDPR